MKHQITLSQAISGYLLAAEARRLSPNTLADYRNTFRKFVAFLGIDPPISHVNQVAVESFLAAQDVSKKTVLNYHTGLSALWTWALAEHLVADHLLHQVQPPEQEARVIVPFSEADIQALLGALGASRPYTRPGKRKSAHSLANTERNRAIILLLLDTGMRASELCALQIHNLDLRNQRAQVFGKGSKERSLPFSARTGQAIWRYLATRRDADLGDPLFTSRLHTPLDRDRLLKQLSAIGDRAGVPDCHPHRFRHTFAVQFLRNGGDAYSLQDMLGHTTLEMVRTYLHLAQVDLDAAHHRASPVDNWRL